MKKITCHGFTFEIVDKVPYGYQVWNIGSMTEGYLPLCKLSAFQPFEGARNVDIDTLKAIRCDNAAAVLRAASRGGHTLEQVKEMIERNAKAPKGTGRYDDYLICKAALPAMQKMTWN